MDVSTGLTLVQTVLQLFDSTIWSEIESVLGVESQLARLKETMSTINNFLLDAEQQERLHQGRCTHTERGRLERLKEALYQADDLFDEVITVARRNELMTDNNLCNKVSLFCSTSNQFCSAFYWSREIKKIRKMLDDIVNDHQYIGLGHPGVSLEAGQVRTNPRETYSLVCEEEDVIIGRDDDKRVVIDMLGDTTVEADVCVISIVGIGGLGKTTLAQLVYNDDVVAREFPLKMWVCVSDDFNVKALLRKILAAATNKADHDGLSLDQLQMKLREALDGKKYLLVLDDVWKENSEEWHKLRNVLIQGGNDSRIVVTTRSQKVADVVGSQKIHELKGLSKEDSWNLFERMTLELGQHQMEAHLVGIGEEIVGKCANVPLAIRVIGSLLRGQDEDYWQYMKDTDLANVKQHENTGIIPVLKISYYYLPFHLKSCFSYCAIFPKDYKIIKQDLICLWMARGLIIPLVGQSFEAAGEKYFMELLERCFFQDVERDEIGGILSCKMHDLIHDVAREAAGIEISNGNHFNEKTRHLLIQPPCLHLVSKMKNLRTLLIDRGDETERGSRKWVLKVRSLRVLRLPDIYPIPSMIGELLHLRYLDLSRRSDVSILPMSITKLYNLQTLKLFSCENLVELPRDLSKLVNLRHLDIDGCWFLTDMPKGFGCLTNLQKLTRFVLGGRRKSSAGVSDLKHLTNLRGSMGIKVHRSFRYDAAEVREERCLRNKPHLLNIVIEWYLNDEDREEGKNSEALLECLLPHDNLTMLMLEWYPGVRFPRWVGPSMNLATCLPNLVKIQLDRSKRLEHLPLMSQLRHLKFLTLRYLKEVEYVDSRNISGEGGNKRESRRQVGVDADVTVFFPSLEELQLSNLPKLKGWWKSDLESGRGRGKTETSYGDGVVNNEQQQQKRLSNVAVGMDTYSFSFPRLSYLKISECPELTTFPLCPKLETLKSNELLLDNEAEEEEVTPSTHCITAIEEGGRERKEDNQPQIPSSTSFISSIAPTLRSLGLYSLSEMVKLPMGVRHLTALRSLENEFCNKLEDIPEWISCLSSLQSLTIVSCRRLKSLPEEMRHLTALHDLYIGFCSKLKDIPEWISCLSSLQSLTIYDCQNLKSLPEEMRHLTSLQQLELQYNSEELNNRCRKPNGEDWPKIKHIPNIAIKDKSEVESLVKPKSSNDAISKKSSKLTPA